MDAEKYKIHHEQKMMSNNGTSMVECGVILSTIPVSVFCSLWITSAIFPLNSIAIPIVEFFVIVLPLILNLTIFSEFSHIILMNLLVFNVLVLSVKTNLKEFKKIMNGIFENDRSIITNYRGSTNMVAAICILAVDFNIFPRRLAKTETFGFGLMDLGVGVFIWSNGLVEKHDNRVKHFKKVCTKCCILFGLGICRLICIKVLTYHEHLTEYGVHWNFFFTLGLCKILICMVTTTMPNANPLWLTLICGATHESLLFLGLRDWVFSDAPRNTFFSANREGLVSCLGFITLYFAASTLGKIINHSNSMKNKSVLVNLFLAFLLTCLGTLVLKKTTGVSRRVVNLGYVFWVTSMSLLVIMHFLIVKIALMSMQKSKKLCIPALQESINANGLFFFILSNLLTGLINFSFQTFLLNSVLSMLILIAYMAILCSVTYYLFVKKKKFF